MRRPSSHPLEQKWPRWEQMLPHLALSALLSACRLLKWHWHGWDTKWTALPEEVTTCDLYASYSPRGVSPRAL